MYRVADHPGFESQFLSQHKFLPESDRHHMKVRLVDVLGEIVDPGPVGVEDVEDAHDPYFDSPPSLAR